VPSKISLRIFESLRLRGIGLCALTWPSRLFHDWYGPCIFLPMPLSILLHFYRNFVLLTSSVTAFECLLLWGAGNPLFIITLLLTKLVSEIFIAALFIFFQGDKLYFYHNLGISRTILFGSALAFDMLIWTIAIVLTNIIA
jgi:hypothetical protein